MKRMLGGGAAIAVFVVLIAVGVQWLHGVANDAPSSPVAPDRAVPGDQPPPPPRSISVAGVRLDNTTPDLSCVVLTNPNARIPVRVTNVTFRHDGDQLRMENTHCPKTLGDKQLPSRDCQAGTMLTPSAVLAEGCRVGAQLRKPDIRWNGVPATVVFALAATCTSRDAKPCDQLGGAYQPSSANPVEVSWTSEAFELNLNPT